MMPAVTFHQLCVAGFRSRMDRTGQTEDDLADLMNQHFGARITGDEIRAMHHDGYTSHFLDMIAETGGKSTLDLIAQMLQMAIPGPHAGCPTCSCGITEDERKNIAAAYQRDTSEGRAALLAVRRSLGQAQATDCDACELASASSFP